MADRIVQIIVLVLTGIFLIGIFLWIPWILVRGALQTLIGRPAGFGWMRVRAEVLTPEVPEQLSDAARRLPLMQYAVYEIDGAEYKTPLYHKCRRDHIKLYVQQGNPQNVWQPQYPDRFTALVGVLFVFGLWAGLGYAVYWFVTQMRG